MAERRNPPIPGSCGHDFADRTRCSCSEDIARFGRQGGWDEWISRIGTLTVLRRMHTSGLLVRRKLIAEMRLRGFSADEIATLTRLIDTVVAEEYLAVAQQG